MCTLLYQECGNFTKCVSNSFFLLGGSNIIWIQTTGVYISINSTQQMFMFRVS